MAPQTTVKTLQLLEPLPYGGKELTELQFGRCTGRVLKRIEQQGENPQSLAIVSELCGIHEDALEDLDLEDAILAAAIAGDLVEKKWEAAAQRAKALGIEVPDAPGSSPEQEEQEAQSEVEPRSGSPSADSSSPENGGTPSA